MVKGRHGQGPKRVRGVRRVVRRRGSEPLGAGDMTAPIEVDPPEDPRIDDALADLDSREW